jgi:hypothetical protein
MGIPRFNPRDSVEFDLSRGQVKVQGTGTRVLVSADALVSLCKSATDEGARDFGRRIGTELGRRIGERFGSEAHGATTEQLIEHVGGELALMGFGSLGAERWGRALVLTLSNSPFGAAGDDLIAAVLEGVLQRAFGRDPSAIKLARDDQQVRFLVTSRAGVERVKSLLSRGVAWGDALARLQAPAKGEA